MTQIANELKPPLDEALEHYGIKGMKWGVRRTAEQLRRASASRDKDILDARKRAPKLDSQVKRKKTQYKNVKQHTKRRDEGRKAAKEALKRARVKRNENWRTATEDTASEAGARLLADIGSDILGRSDFQRIMASEAAVAKVRERQKDR